MSNPTSNFGWQMPTNSDLVTDLPADFEVFGQAVDTSLADLKGGTTGQILSKASGTDMDFTWTDATSGDITGVTAGTGLTGGGTSGSVTLDFDVANYGGGQYAAGKNKIINGDFGIWQRGTSFSGITGGQYTADRWCGNYINGTVNVTQQSFTAGTAPVSGYEGIYFLQLARTSTHASIADYFAQRIEDVRAFAGQTVTFSFWAKVTSGTATLGTYFTQSFGSGGSSESSAAGSTMSLTTTWTRFSTTYSVPSVAGKTIGTGSWFGVQFVLPVAEGNKTWQIWGVQLEAGSIASPFQTATGTKQGELAACMRYYQRIVSGSAYGHIASGEANGTNNLLSSCQFTVPMRTIPTILDTSALSSFRWENGASSGDTPTTLAINTNITTTTSGGFDITKSATFTAGAYYIILGANNTNTYLGWSAEL